jgi:hypothetical protein
MALQRGSTVDLLSMAALWLFGGASSAFPSPESVGWRLRMVFFLKVMLR